MRKFIEIVYRIFTATLGVNVEEQVVIEEIEQTSMMFRKFLEMDPPVNGEEFEHMIARFIHWAVTNHGSKLLVANKNLVYEAFAFTKKNRPELMTYVEKEITAIIHARHGKTMLLVGSPYSSKKVFTTLVP